MSSNGVRVRGQEAFPEGVWTGNFMTNGSMDSLTYQVYYQMSIRSNAVGL